MTPPRKRAANRGATKERRLGRHAKPGFLKDEAPGTIFLLSLLGALPIAVLFIIGQTLLARQGVHPMEVWPTWRILFYVLTPLASGTALWFRHRAPPWAREHNAARAGRALAWANLAIWSIFGSLYLLLFGLA